MGFVQVTGSYGNAGTSSSTLPVPVTNLPSVGNTLLACVNAPSDPGGTVSSVTDPRGNSWAMDQDVTAAYASANAWRADIVTEYQAGDVITFEMTSSTSYSCAAIIEVSGLRGTTVDQQTSAQGNSDTGTCSVTTTNSGDFLVSMLGTGGSTLVTATAPSGWTDVGLTGINLDIAYLEPGAIGTYAASWSWTPASPGTRYAIGEIAYFPGGGTPVAFRASGSGAGIVSAKYA